jgi:hypothetical protein
MNFMSFARGMIAAALLAAVSDPLLKTRRSWRSAPKGYRRINRLNRSQNWARAKSYQHARSISPFPERPVR